MNLPTPPKKSCYEIDEYQRLYVWDVDGNEFIDNTLTAVAEVMKEI